MPRQARSSRTIDTRGLNTRKNTARAAPRDHFARDLDIPGVIIPEGFVYAWLRISTLNEPDHSNWQNKIAKGWSPVPRERHADRFPILNVPGLSDPRFDSIIVKGGLLLIERRKDDVEADKLFQQQETQDQIDSVDWENRQDDAFKGAPRFNDSSRAQIERTVAEFKSDDAD